jgi:polyferredoxin
MIRSLIYLIISLIAVFIFHISVDGTNMTYESLSNAFFYVGIIMFFGGILTVTNVARVFAGASFVVKSLSKEFRERYKTYHDYHLAKNDAESKNIYGGRVLIIGIIYILVALYFAIKFNQMY